MLTKDEKKMLRVVAAYNESTEEQVEKAIVKDFIKLLMRYDTPISNMQLQIEKEEETPVAPVAETPEQPKQRKKPGPKPKKKTVHDEAREIEETEREGKMSREEFIEYFGGK